MGKPVWTFVFSSAIVPPHSADCSFFKSKAFHGDKVTFQWLLSFLQHVFDLYVQAKPNNETSRPHRSRRFWAQHLDTHYTPLWSQKWHLQKLLYSCTVAIHFNFRQYYKDSTHFWNWKKFNVQIGEIIESLLDIFSPNCLQLAEESWSC